MRTAPDAVYVIIPCIKELGMSWNEVKSTPRHELTGLLIALGKYNILHQFDGYSSDDISHMAKDKPQIRSEYGRSMELKEGYEAKAGKSRKVKSFRGLLG
jgi:hypothetical protein